MSGRLSGVVFSFIAETAIARSVVVIARLWLHTRFVAVLLVIAVLAIFTLAGMGGASIYGFIKALRAPRAVPEIGAALSAFLLAEMGLHLLLLGMRLALRLAYDMGFGNIRALVAAVFIGWASVFAFERTIADLLGVPWSLALTGLSFALLIWLSIAYARPRRLDHRSFWRDVIDARHFLKQEPS